MHYIAIIGNKFHGESIYLCETTNIEATLLSAKLFCQDWGKNFTEIGINLLKAAHAFQWDNCLANNIQRKNEELEKLLTVSPK